MFTRSKPNTSFSTTNRPQSIHDVRLNPTFPKPEVFDENNPARSGTLLNPGSGPSARPGGGMNRARHSVFGIDKLWEKETREREEEERIEAERRAAKDAEERVRMEEAERKRSEKERRKAGKKGKKDSSDKMLPSSGTATSFDTINLHTPTSPDGTGRSGATAQSLAQTSHLSPSGGLQLPPSLSLGGFASSNEIELLAHGSGSEADFNLDHRGEDHSGDDSDGDGSSAHSTSSKRQGDRPRRRRGKKGGRRESANERRQSAGLGLGGWFASSDEDEEGAGAKKRRQQQQQAKQAAARAPPESDSDDEVPLSQQYPTGAMSLRSRAAAKEEEAESSEEELPLSELLKLKRAARGEEGEGGSTTLAVLTPLPTSPLDTKPNTAHTGNVEEEEEDDDVPLGLRRQPKDNDDDDVPLGLTQAQHLQQLYYQQQQQQHQAALMFQQQQQQQMMMMGMGGPMMGGMGMGGPMMGMGVGMGGMGMPRMGGGGVPGGMMPGPRPEDKVDRWRRDISTEH